jgi:hypothetical protein
MAGRSRNVAAFERTLAALRTGGRVEPVDAATIALGRTLAALMDDSDEPVVPVAWAYLKVLRELRGAAADDGDDWGQLLAALSAPLGDAPES